ncbi:anti-sigma factor antagonist [Nocardia yunnanensis]|uniref:Anti-sigma factor antagonist n=1 Tax=Nocardia yunnanensis TaxID=2382165 RepID=A0A386ZE53_9NOCA|nr:STAS domain-containing protein [Nocardia yunnanensis]AYF74905.1 anti-sigma factor antagonist [Nocardia yunnanensis]
MTSPLEITVDDRDRATTLTITGEIDMTNAEKFRGALDSARPRQREVTIDLTGVEYLDSSALAVLLPRAHELRVIASAKLRRVLTIGGLTALTTVEFV